jgi:hypothetical protein
MRYITTKPILTGKTAQSGEWTGDGHGKKDGSIERWEKNTNRKRESNVKRFEILML